MNCITLKYLDPKQLMFMRFQ